MLIILTGPAGVGKTTLADKLTSTNPSLKKITTYTTRKPRTGEVHGVDYKFVSRAEFEKKIDNKELLEYANVYGNYYGSSIQEVNSLLNSEKVALFVIDIQGAKTIKNQFPSSVAIFISPPNLQELKNRMLKRGEKNDENLALRLKTAETEMNNKNEFDYFVVNENIEETHLAIKEIIEKNSLRFNVSKP